MKLMLVRHSEPRPRESDPGLTELGIEAARQQARRCGEKQVPVEQIRHSEKKRARETAEILACELKPPQGVVEVEGLKPYDEIEPLAELIEKEVQDVMYVGHLPFLFELVDLLLSGEPGTGIHRFGHNAIVCLSRENEKWKVDWTLPSELAECWPQTDGVVESDQDA
jgi:phosphohistidine phosphatase